MEKPLEEIAELYNYDNNRPLILNELHRSVLEAEYKRTGEKIPWERVRQFRVRRGLG